MHAIGDFLFPRLRSWNFGHPRQNPRTRETNLRRFFRLSRFFFSCMFRIVRSRGGGGVRLQRVPDHHHLRRRGRRVPLLQLAALVSHVVAVRAQARAAGLSSGVEVVRLGFLLLTRLTQPRLFARRGVKTQQIIRVQVQQELVEKSRVARLVRRDRGEQRSARGVVRVERVSERVRVGGLHVAAVWKHHARSRARALSVGCRCLREVLLYDVPERKKSRWESICHARALEVVRVSERRYRSSVNVDVKTCVRYRTVNANTLLTILPRNEKKPRARVT
jgi:hypothetical protein